ncbi:sulfatase domain-containing protein [Nannizzia gypsea CBS 118893]|uniref:Sulfatase domain-containing protein n=1 Tax=Arthroderma gypseum (strain ATCC MYA-4604 / CBS 118893) TaxID=535722 RepID=E4UQ71_ARTGP|nr:sulfatase domain-containing protein [Nannizzia gypsea CBS 118893]EFQ99990.1 sulfatase domain-containing protein [Nannizzia gypsea CBS 118893]
MNIPPFRPSRALAFSLLVVSLIASKCLHLLQFAGSVPLLHFIVFLPTLFISDGLVALVGRVLLHGGSGGALPTIGLVLGSFLSAVTFLAASSQMGFYYVTGTEMQWDNARNVASDPAAIRIMLSGLLQVSVSGFVLLLLSWISTPFLYNRIGYWISGVWRMLVGPKWETILPTVRNQHEQSQKAGIRVKPVCLSVALVTLVILQIIRPSMPYELMSTTIPVAMLRMFSRPHSHSYSSSDSGKCSSHIEAFPLSNLTTPVYWETPNGNFKGWAPGPDNDMIRSYRNRRPEWLPATLPDGFHRWAAISKNEHSNTTSNSTECNKNVSSTYYYNPVADPMRITNLDLGVYKGLEEVFRKESVLISHVLLITMESARKDLFPMHEGSFLHKAILESNDDKDQKEKNKLLSQLTPVAHQITGEGFWNKTKENQTAFGIPYGIWKDSAAPGMGGINIMGAVTGSTLSAKSFLGSHCGVFPLPVDFLEEVTTKVYQPCIPHILNLFNQAKDGLEGRAVGNDSTPNKVPDVKKRKWRSKFIQASTDSYDRQGKLNRQLGLSDFIVKETLTDPTSKYYPPKHPELNYFGYPDDEVKPCISDAIDEALEKNERLFLSHFTSTTHHPWKLPYEFDREKYTGSKGKADHDRMNNYLNTMRYDDAWLGQILGILDEKGIANETLVVVLGDHGQAFEEDSPVQGTYQNGHISNFRVPIVFRHPLLPRINVEANATSMSVLPTILDLLVNSKSLDVHDTSIAQDLIHDYQGQSLIRPFRSEYKGRQSWNIAIINAGGKMISVSSAATPWRVIIPLDGQSQYIFSDLSTDPNELDVLTGWRVSYLLPAVKSKHGAAAKQWLQEADEVASWWATEMRHLWNYNKGSSS